MFQNKSCQENSWNVTKWEKWVKPPYTAGPICWLALIISNIFQCMILHFLSAASSWRLFPRFTVCIRAALSGVFVIGGFNVFTGCLFRRRLTDVHSSWEEQKGKSPVTAASGNQPTQDNQERLTRCSTLHSWCIQFLSFLGSKQLIQHSSMESIIHVEKEMNPNWTHCDGSSCVHVLLRCGNYKSRGPVADTVKGLPIPLVEMWRFPLPASTMPPILPEKAGSDTMSSKQFRPHAKQHFPAWTNKNAQSQEPRFCREPDPNAERRSFKAKPPLWQ